MNVLQTPEPCFKTANAIDRLKKPSLGGEGAFPQAGCTDTQQPALLVSRLSPSQCSPVSLPKPSRYASQPRKKFTEPSSRRWNTCEGRRAGVRPSQDPNPDTCPLPPSLLLAACLLGAVVGPGAEQELEDLTMAPGRTD